MKRFTIDVGDRFSAILEGMAEEEEVTKAEIIRRAVALYAAIKPSTNAGEKLLIKGPDGTIKEVVVP